MDPSNPVENPPKVENVKRAENPSNIENVKPAENPPETVNVKPAENPPETENVKPTENSPETENVEPAAKRPVPPAYELLPENFKATVDQHCPLVVTRGLSAKSDSAYNQVSPPQDRESSSQTSVSAADASLANYGPFPIRVQCPNCNRPVNTRIEFTIGTGTLLASFGCCIISCGICGVLPFFSECTHDVTHLCPQCGRKLGFFKRL